MSEQAPTVDGELLRELREKHPRLKTRDALGHAAQVNWRTIARIESEHRGSYQSVQRISQALGIDPLDVWIGDPPPEAATTLDANTPPAWFTEAVTATHARIDALAKHHGLGRDYWKTG